MCQYAVHIHYTLQCEARTPFGCVHWLCHLPLRPPLPLHLCLSSSCPLEAGWTESSEYSLPGSNLSIRHQIRYGKRPFWESRHFKAGVFILSKQKGPIYCPSNGPDSAQWEKQCRIFGIGGKIVGVRGRNSATLLGQVKRYYAPSLVAVIMPQGPDKKGK